jgi:hypothetical protein
MFITYITRVNDDFKRGENVLKNFKKYAFKHVYTEGVVIMKV